MPATETQPTISPTVHITVLLLIAAFVTAIVLAFLLKIEITARGEGRIVPLTRVQQIQPDTPGKVVAIHVKNGNRVAANSVLIEFDATEAAAQLAMLSREMRHLKIERSRLKMLTWVIERLAANKDADAAAAVREFIIDNTSTREPSYFEEQKNLLAAEVRELKDKIQQQVSKRNENLKSQAVSRANLEQLEASLPIRQERLKASEQLRQQGAASGTAYLNYLEEYITLEKQIAVRRSELDEKASHLARIYSETSELLSSSLSRSRQRLAEIESRILAATDELRVANLNLKNKTLVSPVDGIVDGLSVHTIGGVSDTGDELMRIVPYATGLEVEAVFGNEDVGFLQIGQDANLNLNAFPAERFGFLSGKINYVSADAVRQEDGKWGYVVKVTLERNFLDVAGSRYLLQPGMTASIDVVTGERRLIGYFFAPIVESVQGSLGER
jgi:hemolysin D